MKLSRRKFLTAAGMSAVYMKTHAKGSNFSPDIVIPEIPVIPGISHSPQIILPRTLAKDSTIGITAPASPTSMGEIANGHRALRKMGCKVVVGDTIRKSKNQYHYFSAPDEVRASEFMSFLERDDIDAILCGRGGYGIMRILPLIDFNLFKKHPKIIIGFSDITALLNAVYQRTGLVTFHGPVASVTFNSFTVNHFKQILFGQEDFQPVEVKASGGLTINEGRARGALVGGNLTMITSTLGTDYEIDTKDKILLIEEISEHPYKIDRMLTQLHLAGKLNECSGIIFGHFKGLNSRRPFYPNKSYTIKEVIEQVVKPIGKPTLIGLPFGHIKNKLTLPIGTQVEMDASKKTLTILNQSVIT